MLSTPVPERTAAERRRLAALFLAEGNAASAAVQWFRLDPGERVADEVLSERLVDELERLAARQNENIVIAATLAAELGHERVFQVDDHTGGRASGPIDEESYGRELSAIWTNEWVDTRLAAYDGWKEKILGDSSTEVLEWYRAMNTAEEARLTVASDFGAAAGADPSLKAGRQYLAYWETRNMRMAANVREVIGPGARVLAIVGSSHKPYYERYLGVTSDLEIMDINKILK